MPRKQSGLTHGVLDAATGCQSAASGDDNRIPFGRGISR
jgi:hypothetical protein